MRIKTIAATAVLAVSSFSALAATTALPPLTPSASFSNTVSGSFTDIWTFNLGTASAVAASITNVEVSFGSFTAGGIDGFAAYLNGMQLFGPTSVVGPNSGVTVKTQVLAGGASLAPGMYELKVIGASITGATASYGGNIVATPVPEPETYVMFLAGLGALGFLARRRKNV